MDTITIQIISFQMAALVAILGFLWKLHHEVSNLHKDMAGLRKEVGRDMAGLRKEFGSDMADLRNDVGKDFADVRKDTADLRERMARVEGLLKGFMGRPPEPQT